MVSSSSRADWSKDVELKEHFAEFRLAIAGEIAQSEARLSARIDRLEARSRLFERDVRAAFVVVDGRLGDLERRMTRVEERLDGIDARLDGIDAKLDTLLARSVESGKPKVRRRRKS